MGLRDWWRGWSDDDLVSALRKVRRCCVVVGMTRREEMAYLAYEPFARAVEAAKVYEPPAPASPRRIRDPDGPHQKLTMDMCIARAWD